VLVGLGGHAGLAEHAAGPLVQGREQVDRRAVGGAAAAGRLAVDRHGAHAVAGAGSHEVVGPAGQRGLEGVGVEPGEEGLEGAEGGGPAAVSEAVHQLDGLVAAPLDDGRDAAAAAEHGAAGVGEHGEQGVAAAVAGAGVGDIGQEGEQAAGLEMAHRNGSGLGVNPESTTS
jgi:hypothetical protein